MVLTFHTVLCKLMSALKRKESLTGAVSLLHNEQMYITNICISLTLLALMVMEKNSPFKIQLSLQ